MPFRLPGSELWVKVVETYPYINSILMQNVVIPIDFSETSATAVKFGARLADLMSCNLHIVHVSDLVLSGAHSLTTPEQKRDEKRLESKLTEFAHVNTEPVLTANRGRTPFVPEVSISILSGMAANQILSLSREKDTALIIMGGVGAGAGLHLPGLYGSVATPVAMKSKCPVVLIPKDYGEVNIGKLAIAFDDADEIVRIGEFSRSLIDNLKPEVRYVHVSKANWREEYQNQDEFIDATQGKGVPSYSYELDVLPEGNVAEQLSRYTEEKQIDLLVLGGKRQGFWSRLFDKNNLKPIVQATRVPMMVVPFRTNVADSPAPGKVVRSFGV